MQRAVAIASFAHGLRRLPSYLLADLIGAFQHPLCHLMTTAVAFELSGQFVDPIGAIGECIEQLIDGTRGIVGRATHADHSTNKVRRARAAARLKKDAAGLR
jgi:hypothetical protein